MTKKRQISSPNQNPLTDSFKKQAIEQIYAGKPLTGKNGIFSKMIKDILETALSEELNQHLKSEKEDADLHGDFDEEFISNNRRNGYNSKTIKTKESAFVLNTPRDRNSSFGIVN
jgi:putative transposase